MAARYRSGGTLLCVFPRFFSRIDGTSPHCLQSFNRVLQQKRSLHFTKWKWDKFKDNFHNYQFLQNGNTRGKLLKPVLFTCVVGVASFTGASLLQYEQLRYYSEHEYFYSIAYSRSKGGKGFAVRDKINKWWNRLSEGHKYAACIIALNTALFLCWRIPACQYFLTKWFTSHPGTRRTLPMLLSCFSHADLWHLGCNMVVLWSFAPVIVDILGPEQFLAFYTTGGVVASLASHFYKTIFKTPSFSLGASGAILAVIAMVCMERPEAQLSIIFLPFFSFPAASALIGVMAFDFAGLVLRWQLFDHAAHLGGAIFGLWYSKYGQKTVWARRLMFVRWWHSLRSKKK